MSTNLAGHAAVVLGASAPGSIGAAIAAHLSAAGASVMIAARDADGVRQLAEALGAKAYVCDITSEDEVAALAQHAKRTFGHLDCAVNAAGQVVLGDIDNTTEADFRRALDVHLLGTFLFFKHMARAIERDGAMVTVSSLTASSVINNHAAYTAAKAGADRLMQTAAAEYGPSNIRVNAVAPGFTPGTPMTQEYMRIDGLRELFEKEVPLGRLNTPDDVAHTVAWLCDPATFVTGEKIQVNGGNALTRMPNKPEFIELMKRHASAQG